MGYHPRPLSLLLCHHAHARAPPLPRHAFRFALHHRSPLGQGRHRRGITAQLWGADASSAAEPLLPSHTPGASMPAPAAASNRPPQLSSPPRSPRVCEPCYSPRARLSPPCRGALRRRLRRQHHQPLRRGAPGGILGPLPAALVCAGALQPAAVCPCCPTARINTTQYTTLTTTPLPSLLREWRAHPRPQ
jgi:hypothetical protein